MHEPKAGRETVVCYAQSLHAANFIFKRGKWFPCLWPLFLLKLHILSYLLGRLHDPGIFFPSAYCRWELT